MVLISTSKKHRIGSTVVYPGNIVVKYDANLESEVDEETAKKIADFDESVTIESPLETAEKIEKVVAKEEQEDLDFKKKIGEKLIDAPKVVKGIEGQAGSEPNEPTPIPSETDPKELNEETVKSTKNPDSEEVNEALIKELSELTKAELQDIAKQSDLKEEEWKNLKKSDLVAYIAKNN